MSPRSNRTALVVATALLAGALGTPAAAAPPSVPGVELVEAWPDAEFKKPMGLVNAGDGSDRLFVIEQAGRVQVLPKYRGTGDVPRAQTFLDVRSRVFPRMQGGLLGLAFHPRFATNGKLYLSYLAESGRPDLPYKIVLSEFRAEGDRADPATERVLLEIPKSLANHNAGCAVFGPDGMLYLSTGDNAKQEEALQTSQNPGSLLGKILRIDVNRSDPGLAYAIPSDNPWFAYRDGSVRREIFAYGFRNPWRMAFDADGELWTAEPGTRDVGCREWVVRVEKGGNHGWPYYEGTRLLQEPPPQLRGQRFVSPAFEYRREAEEGATAALGGVVYRGNRLPALRGQYLFADYGRNAVYALQLNGNRAGNMRQVGSLPNISSLGEDEQGEVYVCSHELGLIMTLAPGE